LDDFDGRLTKDGIRIHGPQDFAGMQKAGALAARILDDIAPMIAPGVSTEAIDDAITKMVDASGATSATIGIAAISMPAVSASITWFAMVFLVQRR